MNCDFCTEPVTDEQAVASVPCCDRVYHTVCLVKKTVIDTHHSNYHDITTILCTCQSTIYSEVNQYSQHQTADATEAVATFLESPENREEVKQVKRKNTMFNKSRIVFKRFLRERKAGFKESVQPHVDALEAIKETETAYIKGSTEWKDYIKHERALTRSYEQFRRKHQLYRSTLRELFGHGLRFRYYQRTQRLLREFLKTKV